MEHIKKSISLVLADNHPLFLEGLISVLQHEFSIKGIARNGDSLFNLLETEVPDVAIIDLKMPCMDLINIANQISIQFPSLKIILFSYKHDDLALEQFKLAGIKGYVTKDVSGPDLIEKIHKVANGETTFNIPNTTLNLPIKNNHKLYNLSDRELEIITLICKGSTSRKIADSLYISENTVEAHRKRIFKKINVTNLQGVIEFANRML